jgi:peptide/nickel transport system ATP-binding protein
VTTDFAPTAPRTGTVLEVEDFRVWYAGPAGPVRAVDGVSFSLAPGEVLGLVGESGCGKSTLGRGLMGLLPRGAAVDGVLRFDGQDILTIPVKDRERLRGAGMGLIFQEPMTRLDPLMKVSDHFDEELKAHEPDLSKAERRTRGLDALRALGIPPTRYSNYPHEFSGGMRQRIMIALALALRPKFIVADEPTTALDVLVEAQILRILEDVKNRFHPGILLITHNLGIVAEACDQVAVMYAGRIVEQGPVRDVFANPQHPYTQALLQSTISLSTQELRSIAGAPPDLVRPPVGCRFHPRCEHAMRVCATDQLPPLVVKGTQQAECWLMRLPSGDLRLPLEREEVSVADEA